MLGKSRVALHVAGVCLAFAGLAATATPANAATLPATTPVCSSPKVDGSYICISLDSASSPTTATATLYDQPNGRGWLGKVGINGPSGQLGLSPEVWVGKGGSSTYSVSAIGNGQYCGVAWLWYVYSSSFVEQAKVCVSTS